MSGFFIAGTDTGVGKTRVAAGLIAGLAGRGKRVAGFKPVAAGAEISDGILQNDDALALIDAGNVAVPYATVNPICLRQAIAPHIAAVAEGVTIDCALIVESYRLLRRQAELVIAEGAGGWRVPLGGGVEMSQVAAELGLPVVLVVGIRLGCLNHALLTADAIRRSGLAFAGWVASRIDPQMAFAQDNVDYLVQHLGVPLIGDLAHEPGASADRIAQQLMPGIQMHLNGP